MQDNFQYAESNNQSRWDEVAPIHLRSYPEVEILRSGGIALDEIELEEIGPVDGRTLLHLQCHIGTDSLSWARKGAIVTGVDFSSYFIACAQGLKEELGLPAVFLQSNIYDLRQELHGKFDIVYTSRGVINWLRDLDVWGQIIAHYLKPGGLFYIMESHPILNVFEEAQPGVLSIHYPYFHRNEPTLWDDDDPDYADSTYIPQHGAYEWDWTVGDILNALLNAGLRLESFNEYSRLFFKRSPGMKEVTERWYDFPRYSEMLPLLFTLKARKPNH